MFLFKPLEETYDEVLNFLVLTCFQVYTDTDYIFGIADENEESKTVFESLSENYGTEIWKLENRKNIHVFKDIIENNDIYANNLEKYLAQNFSKTVNDFSLSSGKISAYKKGEWLSFVKNYGKDCVLYWQERNEENED